MSISQMLPRLAGAGLLLLLAACPGRLDNPERFLEDAGVEQTDAGNTGCDVEGVLFPQRCGPCHTPAGQTFPDLTSPEVKTRLLQGQSAGCSNAPLAQHLLDKVRGTQPPTCGSRMPTTGPLPDDEFNCLEAYIQQLLDGGTK